MNILDAAMMVQRQKVKTQASGVLAVAAPLAAVKTMLTISEACANTKFVKQQKELNKVAQRIKYAAVAVAKRDRQIEFSVSPEEQDTLRDLAMGLKAGVQIVTRAVFSGAMLVARVLVRCLVAPAVRMIGGLFMRMIPMLFSPVGLTIAALSAIGYGAYRLYRKEAPTPSVLTEIPEAPEAAAGAAPVPKVMELPTPKLMAPASPIPKLAEVQPQIVAPKALPKIGAVEAKLPEKQLPLGIRNNNPGNLVFANQPGVSPKSGRFAVFPTQNLGLFNLARQLGLHYYNRGDTTITKIITRWAPPNENDTAAYIASVSKQVGIDPNITFDFQSAQVVKNLMIAIIRHENGMQPYSDAQLMESAQAVVTAFADRDLVTPTAGRVSSLFGPRIAPAKGASTNHQGIDIAAPVGTDVVAANGGTIAFAGTKSGYGNVVDVEGGAYYTRYGHLSKFAVKKGDAVLRGQKIGEVGNTGVSSGPHLHFEVMPVTASGPGGRIDPLPLIGAPDKGTEVTSGQRGFVVAQAREAELIRKKGKLIALRS